MEELAKKAKNYYLLGIIAERLSMNSEAASNFFKSLFSADDYYLSNKAIEPKDHSERFLMLKEHSPELYLITDKLFSTYRRTYTHELSSQELKLIKKRIVEAFSYAKISTPTDREIKEKFSQLSYQREKHS